MHCTNVFQVRDVNKDPDARRDLDAVAGAGAKVPALVENGKVMQESGDIIRSLAEMYAHY
jgi:glutathione S-transferase